MSITWGYVVTAAIGAGAALYVRQRHGVPWGYLAAGAVGAALVGASGFLYERSRSLIAQRSIDSVVFAG